MGSGQGGTCGPVALYEGLAVLPIGRRAGWQAGVWRREFAARGVTLYQADCLVAAAAWAHKAVLVTGNPKDFPMDDITVEHWPVGTLTLPALPRQPGPAAP